MSGYTQDDLIGNTLDSIDSSIDTDNFAKRMQVLQQSGFWKGRVSTHRKDGTTIYLDETVSSVRDEPGNLTNYVSVIRDVTKEIHLETQLRSAQKLESIGQLAAGIAHEINTPTQYVGDNTRFLDNSLADVFKLLLAYETLMAAVESAGQYTELVRSVRQTESDIDLQFLTAEMPVALEHSLEGISRISHIVKAMKEFSHPGTETPILTDLNKAIESTATVASAEWKYVATLDFALDPNLPLVPCLPGDFNQVILNMIVNASHAIAEKNGNDSGRLGCIKLSTCRENDWAVICIQDDGNGIPDAIKERIYDPFFTTKGIGKGTGQGLALARSVIVDRHHGTLECDSVQGEGTAFTIMLPLNTLKNTHEDAHTIC
jgi:PAS domain S-box-containing protein